MSLIDEAFGRLERAPVVLGPACDGGYYLVGMRGGVAPIFPAGMPWGTARVLDQTIQLLDQENTAFELLDYWYDVDRPEDLRFLNAHLKCLARGADENHAHTRRVLSQLFTDPAVSGPLTGV